MVVTYKMLYHRLVMVQYVTFQTLKPIELLAMDLGLIGHHHFIFTTI